MPHRHALGVVGALGVERAQSRDRTSSAFVANLWRRTTMSLAMKFEAEDAAAARPIIYLDPSPEGGQGDGQAGHPGVGPGHPKVDRPQGARKGEQQQQPGAAQPPPIMTVDSASGPTTPRTAAMREANQLGSPAKISPPAQPARPDATTAESSTACLPQRTACLPFGTCLSPPTLFNR